ncbi:ectoine/hydroxyectoine ABC transporter substrate-binding protein EhuB [Amycolatopsis echigonensis]|uniref:Amino acid ABC transporter substrate-binding protein (PAAT family) n=1 Tax=Amycolatopsis echigonensis TaxID=2576905 RepID=A0A2N3WLV3_9PSEU|nr:MULTISPECIES: ectoine/hydroxyectoine ABC transporter substrate-binding protein EhuB [Amycolatopsis]MBB2501911.1 ectoine/hydroxyectoine ABC transporter substrate-binding protein EhuB [Amycolatopsis echigonensis]PKV94840.1 amino acid ABC transporter substrate-binding protein (PAAT family) [Amycolatopsis niigatensis]
MVHDEWKRRDFFRLAASGAVVLGGTAFAAACTQAPQSGGQGGGSALERAKKAGTIKVGIAGEIPYGYTEGGNVTGESPEVAKAVFKNIGIAKVEATQVEFKQLIPALAAQQFDMVAAGMAILPSRCKQAAFSAVDYVTPTAFLVPKGNPKQVLSFEDIKAKGVNLAVLSGTVEQQVAKATGIPDSQLQTYDGQPQMLQALQANRAYAGALTDISLKALLKQNPGAALEVTNGFVPVVQGKKQIQAGGFVFRKSDSDLVTAFNTELAKLHQNGQWLEIVKPFGFTKDNLPPADVTTEQLCSGS